MLSILLIFAAALGGDKDKPKVDYAKFGSVARQMVVYENVQRQQAAVERENFRKMREEQLRLQPQRVIVTDRYTAFYGRGYAVAVGVSRPVVVYNGSRPVANRCLGFR